MSKEQIATTLQIQSKIGVLFVIEEPGVGSLKSELHLKW